MPAINPETWPLASTALRWPAHIDERAETILRGMSLEERVGQTLQADIAHVSPDDVRDFHLGAVLNGGNSTPEGGERRNVQAWLDLADSYWQASCDRTAGRTGVPMLWATDAVHGNNNIVGATLFPHNIGLGAANDEELVERIAQITAYEVRVTGQDWVFAPTAAVARNARWGRFYESFASDPTVTARLTNAMLRGLQGPLGPMSIQDAAHVLATVKHFVGDGGTARGIDQGDFLGSEEALRDVHSAPYYAAIAAGAQVVMASFHSHHGDKLHAHKTLLTDILRDRMGFDGFVIGDWNGHAQVPGQSTTSAPQSLMAGIDMLMAPENWRDLYRNTLAQVKDGTISETRLNEAVLRILRVKIRSGLLESGRPSARTCAGEIDRLGHPTHRAVAREAARRSLVLLKNNDSLLPIRPGQKVLITGDAADDIGMQCGGWTLGWQGRGNSSADFPNATSIAQGMHSAIQSIGGQVIRDLDGPSNERPDVAVVVFGETPYAEGFGDLSHLGFSSNAPLEQLRSLKNAGIPTVSVFLSGRPLWTNPELNASDAFVAAWLPGSEGGALGDLFVSDQRGDAKFDFEGRLPFQWPLTANQDGSTSHEPLFDRGYGLSYKDLHNIPVLPESPGFAGDPEKHHTIVKRGLPIASWTAALCGGAEETPDDRPRHKAFNGRMEASFDSKNTQDDCRVIEFLESDCAYVLADRTLAYKLPDHGSVLKLIIRTAHGFERVRLNLHTALGDVRQYELSECDWTPDQTPNWREIRIRIDCSLDGDRLKKFSFESTGPATIALQSLTCHPR